MGDWVKGIKIDVEENLIFAWNHEAVCFYSLRGNFEYQPGQIEMKYDELNMKEDYITDLLLFGESKSFLTSTQFGNINAWKQKEAKKLIHQFTGHIKTVTSLMRHPRYTSVFVSASLDNTIRVWCIEVNLPLIFIRHQRLVELYCFDLNKNQQF